MARHTGEALEGSGKRAGDKMAEKAPAKQAMKKAGKHPAKHAAKAAKKANQKAGKHGVKHEVHKALDHVVREMDRDELLAAAFHHLSRAAAVISLLEQESGGDLRMLLDRGVSRYEEAALKSGRRSAEGAYSLLRAAEHLGMAGLYAVRSSFAAAVAQVESAQIESLLGSLPKRFNDLDDEMEGEVERLRAMGLELARTAEAADSDLHLVYELTMAAHWICSVLERELL